MEITKTNNNWGDSEPNVDSGDQARALDASDEWEDSNNDSDDTKSDNSTTDHSEGLESDLELEEEVLIASYLDLYGKPDSHASFAICVLPFVRNHSSFGKCLWWDFEHHLSLCRFHFSFVRNSKCRLHIAFFPTDLVNFTSENLKCTSQNV